MNRASDFSRDLERARQAFGPAGIPWAVAAGAGVFLYTGSRLPTDLDLLVLPSHLDKASAALGAAPHHKQTSWGEATELSSENTEVAGRLDIRIEGVSYCYEMDEEMVAHSRMLEFQDTSVPVLAPEDLIALKLVLQRGAEQGKHDLEDVEALAGVVKVDPSYLRWRLQAMGAQDRARTLMERWGW